MIGLVPHHLARSQHPAVQQNGAAGGEDGDDVGDERTRQRHRRGAAAIPARREMPPHPEPPEEQRRKIGRASCRARVCQYVSISVVAVSLNKKTLNKLKSSDTKQDEQTA